MKKLGLLMIIALLVAGTAFAQWGRGPGWNPEAWTPPQATSISGTLQLQQGMIAVVSGTNTYFAPRLTRFAGFIPGLTEGAQVSMEGFLRENFFFPTTLTIAGRTHNLVPDAAQGFAPGRWGACPMGRQPQGRQGRRW